MSFLKKSFFIGEKELPNNILYSPLAGCSDYPFRKISRRYGPGIVYCEMVKMDALVRKESNTYRMLDFDSSMHPIGAQLCGSKLELAATCARIIEDLGFDVVDLNCGCPVDKVTKDGSGSGMLKTPHLIGEILSAMVAAVKIPVTVKIRAGWDDHSILAPLITQIAEQAGAKAIAIHGRTREQGYRGSANWDHIRACKEVAKEILVIGNGDLFTAERARKCFASTGCDAVLLSRGTMGQPWIAEDVICTLQGGEPMKRGILSIRDTMLDHFAEIVRYQDNEVRAALDFRRVGCWYLKHFPGAKALRAQLVRCTSPTDAFSLIEQFDWLSLADSERVDPELIWANM
ncbi:MAG TPA: tRNA dihydrouridine synthase DusB [Chlamydiales bacterium]|nr:tRNA dihydrouridine synthase DusB [Chlamydiales bacterium]